jgi:chromosome segregation ATPase
MIAAVKVESTALDSMREKLKEVDNLRAQISAFNKRLIDADQSNLNLKANLMKVQEQYSELKKQKIDCESMNVQLRSELHRTKEFLTKEKSTRQLLQSEIVTLREQIGRYEAAHENYERELKQIPTLQESNEILKQDLMNFRRKYKEEKGQLIKQVKTLENQHMNVEMIKNEVRTLAMRLLDVSNGTMTSSTNNNNTNVSNSNINAGKIL